MRGRMKRSCEDYRGKIAGKDGRNFSLDLSRKGSQKNIDRSRCGCN